jgi:Mn-dependent DtxR family transcriptional regulator
MDSNWLDEFKERQKSQLREQGFIEVNENGEVALTDKGKSRVANRLDRLPLGDEFLIQVAVLDAHGITVVG